MRRSIWDRLGGAAQVDAAIERRLDRLREEGALGEEEAARLRTLLLRAEPDALPLLPEVPSRSDLATLSAQVDALTMAVEQLLAERGGKG